jgi:hypothetical protein
MMREVCGFGKTDSFQVFPVQFSQPRGRISLGSLFLGMGGMGGGGGSEYFQSIQTNSEIVSKAMTADLHIFYNQPTI